MTLHNLQQGERGIITKVNGHGSFRKRITEMGFIIGKEIEVIKKAPLKDPIEYKILDYFVSLRNSEALLIDVISEKEAAKKIDTSFNGTIDSKILKQAFNKKGKNINIAFVGNPNCGKTTIFNQASGSSERVGNYSGVTVDAKKSHFKLDGYKFNVVDLPGTYSITAYSPEELYVRDYIIDQHPDIVINVIDASNLERNLYLTTQLIDMDIKVVIALNMYDELEKNGDSLDYFQLGKMLGIPFIPTVGSKGIGIKNLFRKVIDVYEDRDEIVRHIHVNYGKNIETSIQNIQNKIKQPANHAVTNNISPRFLSIKLIEKDKDADKKIATCHNATNIRKSTHKEIDKLEKNLLEDSETLVTDAKYAFIAGALCETMVSNAIQKIKKSQIIDTFITNKFWGIPIFAFFMWLTFFTTFKLGQYPMNWIESGVSFIGQLVHANMSDGMLKDLLINGIIGGVGGVLVFLPNIVILYFFIAIMEDTGYMARAVFIMDKMMHKIGLHGKSFIPMLMGFGCNVPAIMATRTIESRRDRLLTMLIIPFMSCSAKLPVYILFITAFFTSYQATILFSMYIIGVIIAIGSSMLLSKTLFKKVDIPFVMELPPYRTPSLRSLLIHMWNSAEQYLRKIAGVILIASIIIWALGYFPHNIELSRNFDKEISHLE
ncbi:MAG: ferrous iron transport protein B, partial [Bacteroidota bacterium]|nr:ferrous iron transport protein B [Bacteroidota bacterium]